MIGFKKVCCYWDHNGAQILAVKKREIKIHNNAICDSQNGIYVIDIYPVTRVTSLLLNIYEVIREAEDKCNNNEDDN